MTEEEKYIEELLAEIERLRGAMKAIEPFLDCLVCYASTQGEYEPNRIVAQFSATMKGETP